MLSCTRLQWCLTASSGTISPSRTVTKENPLYMTKFAVQVEKQNICHILYISTCMCMLCACCMSDVQYAFAYLLQEDHIQRVHVVADQLVGGFVVNSLRHMLQNIRRQVQDLVKDKNANDGNTYQPGLTTNLFFLALSLSD